MRYPTQMLRHMSLLAALAVAPVLKAEKLVLASSTATREYLQRRMVDGKRLPQSYVFMAGRYFSGTTHDNSLEKTSFRTIAERLALDLRQQDFNPAPSLAKADLLLVVHWGVTAGRNRDSAAVSAGVENLVNLSNDREAAESALKEAETAGDALAAWQARGTLDNLELQTNAEYQNMTAGVNGQSMGEDSAALLGLTSALRKDDETLAAYERRKTLFEMTREECYFIVVMAYDAATLRETKKLKRVWTLRTSINSAGVNFHQALDRISNISGRYFGTKQDNIGFDYPADRKREENVKLGELVVLGAVNR